MNYKIILFDVKICQKFVSVLIEKKKKYNPQMAILILFLK